MKTKTNYQEQLEWFNKIVKPNIIKDYVKNYKPVVGQQHTVRIRGANNQVQ